MSCYCTEKSEVQKKKKKGPLIKMAPTLKIFGVVSRFLYSGGWQVWNCLQVQYVDSYHRYHRIVFLRRRRTCSLTLRKLYVSLQTFLYDSCIYLVELMSLNGLVILHFICSRFKCSCFRATLLTVLCTVYAIGQISSRLHLVQARPSFDPPCGSHQLPVIQNILNKFLACNCHSFSSLALYRQILLVQYYLARWYTCTCTCNLSL